ncbi:MAG TPA: hypothetical protein VF145_06625 [Chitinophagaceae bacterium]
MKVLPAEQIRELKAGYDNEACVWFLVNLQYRIIAFNKKAAENSISLHRKEITAGSSILDYARDTKNRVDSEFIRCFGKSATGKKVEQTQKIIYNSATITTKAVYTPVYLDKEVAGISIVVEDITAGS